MVIFLLVIALALVLAAVFFAGDGWARACADLPYLPASHRALGAVFYAGLRMAPRWLSEWVVNRAYPGLFERAAAREAAAPSSPCRFLGTRASCSCCSAEHFSC